MNYERLEQAIINSHLKLNEKLSIEKNKEREKRQSDWDKILKIESIPEKCSFLKKRRINFKNELKYLKAFFLYKKEYAEYTSANKELQRLFPISMFILAQHGTLLVAFLLITYMIRNGFNMALAITAFICFIFSFIFRMAKIELDKTDDKEIIDSIYYRSR